jgi:hypothetical protein
MTRNATALSFLHPPGELPVALEVSLEQAAQQLHWPKGLVWQVAKPLRSHTGSIPVPGYSSPNTTWLPWQPLLNQVHCLQHKALHAPPSKKDATKVKPLFKPLPHTIQQGVPALQHFKQQGYSSFFNTASPSPLNNSPGSSPLVFQRLLPKL